MIKSALLFSAISGIVLLSCSTEIPTISLPGAKIIPMDPDRAEEWADSLYEADPFKFQYCYTQEYLEYADYRFIRDRQGPIFDPQYITDKCYPVPEKPPEQNINVNVGEKNGDQNCYGFKIKNNGRHTVIEGESFFVPVCQIDSHSNFNTYTNDNHYDLFRFSESLIYSIDDNTVNRPVFITVFVEHDNFEEVLTFELELIDDDISFLIFENGRVWLSKPVDFGLDIILDDGQSINVIRNSRRVDIPNGRKPVGFSIPSLDFRSKSSNIIHRFSDK